MQFQFKSAGINECEENTTFTEVDKHTVFLFQSVHSNPYPYTYVWRSTLSH
jgi:hypothetical protein